MGGIMNYIDKEVVWAKGRSRAEKSKYTTWSGGNSKSSDGRSYQKYFQIPVDKVEDFCQALIEARDFTLANKPNTK